MRRVPRGAAHAAHAARDACRRCIASGAEGGFWREWERQAAERRAAWEEAAQRRQETLDDTSAEWARLRAAWAQPRPRERSQPSSRFTWWWEQGAEGQRVATPEATREWERRFQAGEAAQTPGRRAQPPSDALGHYAALGLKSAESRKADAVALQAAFRRTVLQCHPDTAPTDAPDAGRAARFRRAVDAYEVLRDPDRRARYDRTGA